uniref:Uncharacterized protein n=1 Tax=viral metagenome TaxID=1070528 RepID=A0A6M3IFU8_9ZZZZ
MVLNFVRDLADGHGFEDEILAFIHLKHPSATRVLGNFKGYDIEVPSLKHRIECKFDRMSERTGNIAVEFECSGKPSGINNTKATHWIHKYHHDGKWLLAIARVSVFKQLCEGQRVVKGGDNYSAKMYLVPKELLKKTKGIKIKLPVDKN